jgi:hypothetical protein
MNKLLEIESLLDTRNIDYRIINNTIGKNLILLENDTNLNLKKIREELNLKYKDYIQDIIIVDSSNNDDLIVNEIRKICKRNSILHRNISYINWSRKEKIDKKYHNIIAGYSFKGGMGRSTTLAYLARFYYLLGKKVVVFDFDFEAPGISSLFFKKDIREKKAGILDYLIDINLEENLNLDNYFLQNEVSNNSGNLYLFPSGIDFHIENYINKISKIDFNSNQYINHFQKLLDDVTIKLKPDLIFIDLRAGINESNGYILKNLSNKNLLFFNSEEQNEDGLKVILNSLNSLDNSIILNSTIRYLDSDTRELKEEKFDSFLRSIDNDYQSIPIEYRPNMLDTNIIEFKKFVDGEYSGYNDRDIYLQNIIEDINSYFKLDEEIDIVDIQESEVNVKNILFKLRDEFKHLTAMTKFDTEDNLKYFYFKEDISKLVNEQIFLILGAKGSGKSALFEIFTKNYKSILEKLNIKNNVYIGGFSKEISKDYLSKDYLRLIYIKSASNLEDLERFWKFLTLYQVERELENEDKFFKNIDDIREKFINGYIGLDVDERLKDINIELYKDDKSLTLVYDELDIELIEREDFINSLVEFWRGNLYKYSQIRSKILLRNDIFEKLNIENKTHLDFNKYELKWNKKEILSLILKIIVTSLDENELEAISLLDIVKNKKNNEITEDMKKINKGIYQIFGKKLNLTQTNISTMDNWIISQLSDAKGNITPRVIYKFVFESILKELEDKNSNSKQLLKSFSKNYKDILLNVSKHRLIEYNEEYKGYDKYYKVIQIIGYRMFEDSEYKKVYNPSRNKKTYIKAETIDEYIKKLIDSGFISIKDEKTKTYQVANVYVPALDIKMNRQGRRKVDIEE